MNAAQRLDQEQAGRQGRGPVAANPSAHPNFSGSAMPQTGRPAAPGRSGPRTYSRFMPHLPQPSHTYTNPQLAARKHASPTNARSCIETPPIRSPFSGGQRPAFGELIAQYSQSASMGGQERGEGVKKSSSLGKTLDGHATGVRWCAEEQGMGHGCHPCLVFVGSQQAHKETMTLAETEDTRLRSSTRRRTTGPAARGAPGSSAGRWPRPTRRTRPSASSSAWPSSRPTPCRRWPTAPRR